MATASSFHRAAGIAAYLVAAFSILYAVVFLGFVRTDPNNTTAASVASALIAAGALSAALATAGFASYLGGAGATFLAAFGVGYSLLAAAHGVYAAITAADGTADLAISPTDPRGFATFGLAGVWLLVAGTILRGRADLRRVYWQIALLAGIDLILLFFGTVAGATPVILVTGGFASVILVPAFWLMTGRLLTVADADVDTDTGTDSA
ncbi:MAG TPA: hypothetical protein VM052_09145 [Candidatus Limnocylindrales bacterium]|nr:hypothetical protein [Candidatus Limnocylindrales bacterium]